MKSRDLSGLELVGNALCLDFANTVNSRRHTPAHDYIASYEDLLRWSEYVGAVSPGTLSAGPPLRQTTILAAAHRLRDAIYATFGAIAAGGDPAAIDVRRISEAYRDGMSHTTIARNDEGGFGLSWTTDAGDTPVWSVALSAGDLLLTEDLSRIGECPSCGWLFLDTSRNGTRRWCSMATCGSRDKMARYHRRSRT